MTKDAEDLLNKAQRDLRMVMTSAQRVTSGNIGHQIEYVKMWIKNAQEKIDAAKTTEENQAHRPETRPE
jgi:HEPN domain-containing protein